MTHFISTSKHWYRRPRSEVPGFLFINQLFSC